MDEILQPFELKGTNNIQTYHVVFLVKVVTWGIYLSPGAQCYVLQIYTTPVTSWATLPISPTTNSTSRTRLAAFDNRGKTLSYNMKYILT